MKRFIRDLTCHIYGVDIIQQNHSLIINKHNDYVETTFKIVILGIVPKPSRV